VRQHPADRRALQRRVHRGGQPTCRASRPGGGDEESWLVKEVFSAGCTGSPPPGARPPHRLQADYEISSHQPDGLPGLLPRRRRPSSTAKDQRHPGRDRAWLGCRCDVSPTRWASPTSTRSSTA
jgi:hypothetical protein